MNNFYKILKKLLLFNEKINYKHNGKGFSLRGES